MRIHISAATFVLYLLFDFSLSEVTVLKLITTLNKYRSEIICNNRTRGCTITSVKNDNVSNVNLTIEHYRKELEEVRSQNFTKLEIIQCQFYPQQYEEVVRAIFRAFSSIESLRIQSCTWFGLPHNILQDLRKLTKLVWVDNKTFYNQKWVTLQFPERFFENLSNLKYLQISKNVQNESIKFHEKLFDSLTRLTHLDLSDNDLQVLPRLTSHLMTHLNLSKNWISKIIPEDYFENLSKIKILDLSENPLDDIPENSFRSNTELEELIIERDLCGKNSNRMFRSHLFKHAKNLKTFSYSVSSISSCRQIEFQKDIFSNQISSLKQLRISNTKLAWENISSLFRDLNFLEVLDLSSNSFEAINLANIPSSITKLDLASAEVPVLLCEFFQCQDYTDLQEAGRLVHNLTCLDNGSEISYYKFCEVKSEQLVLGCTLGGLLILLLALVIFIWTNEPIRATIYQFRFMQVFFVPEKDTDDKEFDVFISYSEADSDFAYKIQNVLENGQGTKLKRTFSCCLHERDWSVGSEINENILHSVKSSRRTLVILSPSYVDSPYCNTEFSIAFKARNLLAVMRLEKMTGKPCINHNNLKSDSLIKHYITSYTYLKENDPNFWNRLIYRLPHKKPSQQQLVPKLTSQTDIVIKDI